MLVIQRKRGERLFIGDDIEVVVTDVSKYGVRIGIIAPRAKRVVRAEVRESVERLNRAAADTRVDQLDALFPLDVGDGLVPAE
jgi:carbon storage regulator